MKFTAIKDNLTTGLNIVQRALSAKSVQPILSGIYLSARNGHLTMVATDTIENAGLRIQCTVPVDVIEEGDTVVSGKSFRDFVMRLPDTNLLFENTSYNGQDKMTIHYEENETEMIGWPGYEFPKPPKMDILHCMSISQVTLSDLVRQTSFAARKEDLRPIFTGLLFEVSGNDLTVVGTDSFRLAMMEEKVNNESGGDFHVVIPVRALQEVISVVEEDAIIHISVTNNQILFESGDVQITSQLIKGEFPPYRAALPKSHTTHFDIDRAALRSSIDRATLFGRDRDGTSVIRLHIEGGKLTIAHEPFDFKISLQGVINLIQPQALERGLDFEVSLSGVDEEELLGDALRLNQILINILSNALKFTPVGGSIRLEVHQLHKKNNNVQFRFVIRDTGIGMSQEFIKRLYTPFEQATSSTASKFGGTGLGMAITKNLVSLLGGTIFVKSEEGRGTEFTVELPFGLSGRQLEKGKGELEPLKVLVVDDDYDTCEHACLLLDKMGLRTRWVLSGAEAVKVVQESHVSGDDYDVCFIDWKMPDMDGMETVRRIRNEVGPETLIIIISAYDWGAIEEKARAIGVNGFIAKPFFASNLYNTLTSLTRRTAPKREIEVSATQESEAETAHQHYDFTGKHILLVEDNEFNREVAQEFLEMTGATVESAENGSEGVALFTASETGQYDIILMDVQMPVMDGYEATRAIRASVHPDANSIPILAMTANAFNEDVAAAVAAGMNGHIAKPIDVTALYRLLASHFK